jgi:hypothetical protein
METIRIRKRLDSETLHLPELRPLIGREVEIVISECVSESVPAPDSGAESILEMAQRITARIPPEVLEKLPKDGAAEHDHYLYGSPKRYCSP